MYKIFIGNVPVFLTTIADEDVIQQNKEVLYLTYRNQADLLAIADYVLSNHDLKKVYIQAKNVDILFSDFAQNYEVINAAGGAVCNPNGEILMIYRADKWELPKGKVERGEKIEQAAVREVSEETSIIGISLRAPILLAENNNLNVTYHTFFKQDRRRRVLKRTYWYLMDCDNSEIGVPQLEEGITQVAWVNPADVPQYLENSFESVKDVMNAVLKIKKTT